MAKNPKKNDPFDEKLFAIAHLVANIAEGSDLLL